MGHKILNGLGPRQMAITWTPNALQLHMLGLMGHLIIFLFYFFYRFFGRVIYLNFYNQIVFLYN